LIHFYKRYWDVISDKYSSHHDRQETGNREQEGL